MKTRERLASELRKIAAQASPANAAKYEAFAVRAATGEFDDYADTYCLSDHAIVFGADSRRLREIRRSRRQWRV